MDILTWVILGLVAGFLASVLMRSSNGLVMDIVLGVVGAVVGGYIMNLLGQGGVSGFNLYSIVVAVIGAAVLIWIGRVFNRNY
jgi:uncharacterized membrane protein YeaQ/YmgE (transglycosylase-associated protein family)